MSKDELPVIKEYVVKAFFENVIPDLSESTDDLENQNIEKIINQATDFYLDLQVDPIFLNSQNPDSLHRAYVTIAIASEWVNKNANNSQRTELSEHLLKLFPNEDRNYFESVENDRKIPLSEQTIRQILQKAFQA